MRILAIMDSKAAASLLVAGRAATMARDENATLTLMQMWSCRWLEIGISSPSVPVPITRESVLADRQAWAATQVGAIRRAICDEPGVRTQCRKGGVWAALFREVRRDAYDTVVMAKRTGAGSLLLSYLRSRGIRLVLVEGDE